MHDSITGADISTGGYYGIRIFKGNLKEYCETWSRQHVLTCAKLMFQRECVTIWNVALTSLLNSFLEKRHLGDPDGLSY